MIRKVSFLLVFLLAFSFVSFGQVIDNDLQQLMNNSRSDSLIPIVVDMQEQFNVSEVTQNARGNRDAAISILKAQTRQSQSDVRGLLAGQRSAKNVHYFWLTNTVSLEASKGLIEQLAQTPGVASIVYDKAENMISPIVEEPARGNWGPGYIGSDVVNANGVTGKNVLVGVIDTGLDEDHPLFKAGQVRLDLNKSFIDGQAVEDGNGHGTHCATTIAGQNGVGVAPDAQVFSVKGLSNAGSGTWAGVQAAIEYAVEQNPDVISMSLGGGNGSTVNDVERAVYNGSKMGVTFAIAAGNSGKNRVGTPGCVPTVVTVGAIDSSGKIAYFSSYGTVADKFKNEMTGYLAIDCQKPDVSAPGVAIEAGWKNGGMNTISGTSMATPHVAGVCALMTEAGAKDPQNIKRTLETTVKDSKGGKDAQYGYGVVDAQKAVGQVAANQVFSGNTRADIEKIVEYQVDANGNVNVSLNKQNPLPWAIKVKVTVTVLDPAGTFSGAFTITKAGKNTQSGSIQGTAGTPIVVGVFDIHEGENTLNYSGTSSAKATTGHIKVEANIQ